jgi:hypothetical protein
MQNHSTDIPVMNLSAADYFRRLLHVPEQSRSARTVELFGWLMLIESPFMLIFPHSVASFLGLPALGEQGASYEQAANYFRIMGCLSAASECSTSSVAA